MISLFVVVEGPTEETFVNQVLSPHLQAHSIWATPIIVKTRQNRDGTKQTGGSVKWSKCLKELRDLLRTPTARLTTMFDYYRLPRDFPGVVTDVDPLTTAEHVAAIEAALGRAVGNDRFVPYVQRHEFEALVLASIDMLGDLMDPMDRPGWKALRLEIEGIPPEDVNDGVNTAPSKRLEHHIASYQKVLHGPMATTLAGLPAIRAACPRFDAWVTKLETLATETP